MLSTEQAAQNWDLPLSAIYEAIRYCETHQELLKLEADEERDHKTAHQIFRAYLEKVDPSLNR